MQVVFAFDPQHWPLRAALVKYLRRHFVFYVLINVTANGNFCVSCRHTIVYVLFDEHYLANSNMAYFV